MEWIKKVNRYLHNDAVSLHNRMFMLISGVAILCSMVTSVFVMILMDLVLGVLMLVSCLVGVGLIAWGYRMHKLEIVAVIICGALSIIGMPYLYFSQGGATSDVMIGYVIVALYITLVLPGKSRTVMRVLLAASCAICVFYDFYRTYQVLPTVSFFTYLRPFLITVLLCTVTSAMAGFQNRLFFDETERSEKRRKEIERLSASQNQFFSSMSHEIRTPINTIIGLNEMILREDVSEEVAEDAANIQSASKLLLSIINDILDMSKFESGQMHLSEASYHPGDMLSDVVGMLWLRAKEKGLEFHVNVAPDIPYELYGDEVRIKQILINIVNNAIKYTKEGSVTLSIQCGERDGNMVHIQYSVSDTGMGIKKEDIPYLFTAFKRVDEDSNRHIEGTGLGLSIVKQFVDLMNGTVTVNSVYTKGSTFIIDIPQRIESNKEIGNLEIESKHRMNERMAYHQKFEAPDARVLVVDDNASNIMVVNKLLRDTKIQIDNAASGAEALERTVDKEYHVILMDHMMPEMDGIECHRQIRNQTGGRCRESRIVALTANAGSDVQALYAREGFDGYIVKPISGDLLERELYRLLPRELVIAVGKEEEIATETTEWMHSDMKKKPILITTESVADLPDALIKKYGILMLPHMVKTEEGVFRDGKEIETNGLLQYMENEERKVDTIAPTVAEHETFFADALSGANNVIHISISSKIAKSGCPAAVEAASVFDNVFVVDTGHLSSGQGLMVLTACKMAEEGKSVPEILRALKSYRSLTRTSFVVDNMDFLARAGQIPVGMAKLIKAFSLHPMLSMRNGNLGVGGVYMGSRERAWKKYIRRSLLLPDKIDRDMLFVTYVGITKKEMEFIEEEIRKYADFKTICFQKASPAIAVNCGPGTFGLLYQIYD